MEDVKKHHKFLEVPEREGSWWTIGTVTPRKEADWRVLHTKTPGERERIVQGWLHTEEFQLNTTRNMCKEVLEEQRKVAMSTANQVAFEFSVKMVSAASEIAGGLGLAESINAGDNFCIAQAQHGSAPDIAGKNIANPVSLIGSTAMLLDWLGKKNNNNQLKEIAELIENAIDKMVINPETRTPDIGGTLSTTEFTKKLIEHLK